LDTSKHARDEASAASREAPRCYGQLGGFASSDADLGAIRGRSSASCLSNVKRHTPGLGRHHARARADGAVLSFDDDGPPFTINGHAQPDLMAESGRGLFHAARALGRDVSVQRIGARNRVAVALPLEPD